MTADNVTPLGGKSRAAAMAPTSEAEARAATPWPELLPLDSAATPPAFPVESLPPAIRDFVAETSEGMRTAPDLLATFALAAVSAVTGGRWTVSLEWTEPLVLHTVVVAPPGSMKSAAMAEATRPLVALERELAERYGPEVAVAESKRRMDQKRLAEYEAKAAKGSTTGEDNEGLALDLARDLEENPVQVVPAIFTTDGTAEAVEQLLQKHGERFAWLDAEGGYFTMVAGRYSAKGSGANLDVFVKAHSGDAVKVHRVGREPVSLDSPALTVGIAAQPSHLMAAAGNSELMGRGIFARLLYSWPDLQPVDRSQKVRPVDPARAAEYESALRDLWKVAETISPGTRRNLTVDPDADDVLRSFFRWTFDARQDGGELHAEGLDSWASKLDGQTLRLAGMFALIENPGADTVTVADATRAVNVARYFVAHARRAFGEVGLLPELAAARRCWKAIKEARQRPGQWKEWPAVVTTRDVMESVKGSRSLGLDTAEGVKAALAHLAENGRLRPLARETGSRGKPSERWEVNPEALAES